MTFDEAIEKIEELQGSAGYATGGVPEANNFSGYDVHEYLNTATEIINELREEYAPTVEMSQEQKEVIIEYMNDDAFDFTDFMENEAGATFLFMDMKEKDLMQAWQHPETIKVVDE